MAKKVSLIRKGKVAGSVKEGFPLKDKPKLNIMKELGLRRLF